MRNTKNSKQTKDINTIKISLSSPEDTDIIDPAIKPSEMPRTLPIPNNAIPTVAMVDHELPDANETIAQIIQDAKRKISGFKIFNP